MLVNHKEFWSRLQDSVDVVVASRDAEQLLGVRDGFRRYFEGGLERHTAVSVRSSAGVGESATIWTTTEATLAAAERQAEQLRAEVGEAAMFCVATEEGLATLDVDGSERSFLVCWAVVMSPVGTACGGGGPIEIPERFTETLDTGGPVKVPGTRRRGGILGSLTGGLESRREIFSLATFHAISSHFFGLVAPPHDWFPWGD